MQGVGFGSDWDSALCSVWDKGSVWGLTSTGTMNMEDTALWFLLTEAASTLATLLPLLVLAPVALACPLALRAAAPLDMYSA